MSRYHFAIDYRTTAGEADYLLHVLVAGIAELDELLRKEISRMPRVQRETDDDRDEDDQASRPDHGLRATGSERKTLSPNGDSRGAVAHFHSARAHALA